MKREDNTGPKVIQPTENMDTEQNEKQDSSQQIKQ